MPPWYLQTSPFPGWCMHAPARAAVGMEPMALQHAAPRHWQGAWEAPAQGASSGLRLQGPVDRSQVDQPRSRAAAATLCPLRARSSTRREHATRPTDLATDDHVRRVLAEYDAERIPSPPSRMDRLVRAAADRPACSAGRGRCMNRVHPSTVVRLSPSRATDAFSICRGLGRFRGDTP